MKLMMFVKHVQDLPLAESGRRMRELGLEGMDLTVRPSGVIKPERVREELPQALATLRDCGLVVPLLTTDLLRDDEHARATFETASSLGIKEIKLGYVRYLDFGTFHQQLADMQRDLDGIEKLAQRTGVRANLHTHSGDHMTAQAAVVWHLIKDRDPNAIGAYIDPGHLTAEGSRDGWRQGIDLLGSRITLVALKDVARPTNAAQADIRKTSVVPMGEGIVDWKNVIKYLKAAGFDGWMSMHAEYGGMTPEQVFEQTGKDLDFFSQSGGINRHVISESLQHDSKRGSRGACPALL